MKTSLEVLARRSRALRNESVTRLSLGEPPPERSALAEYLRRPPPPAFSVAIDPVAHAKRLERRRAAAEAAAAEEEVLRPPAEA